MEKKDILKISNIIFDYVFKLDDDLISELLNGDKRIALIENDKKTKKNNTNNDLGALKVKTIINTLNSFGNREEAKAYLIDNKFTVKLLKDIAKQTDIYIKSKYNKSQIIDSLIEGTVGANIKMNILMGE